MWRMSIRAPLYLRWVLLSFSVMGLAASCAPSRPDSADRFPRPDRPVSKQTGADTVPENIRDNRGEAMRVMDFAGVSDGMTVADIGAGAGYYTVRLAQRVGAKGRVLAQDIDENALEKLGRRVERERLDNVAIKLGKPDDPSLPDKSFDVIFMVHMYHEVAEPYAFLWRMWPALKENGIVVVVDVDRPTDQHGIAPLLMSCELQASGFSLLEFKDAPKLHGYYAKFKRSGKRPNPNDIKPCKGALERAGG